jgi:hypothetical protein
MKQKLGHRKQIMWKFCKYGVDLSLDVLRSEVPSAGFSLITFRWSGQFILIVEMFDNLMSILPRNYGIGRRNQIVETDVVHPRM